MWLLDYFEGEWLLLDENQGPHSKVPGQPAWGYRQRRLPGPDLCQPSSVSFEDCLNQGKVVVAVLAFKSSAESLLGRA